MQNDKPKFKTEFKKRLYTFVLRLIEFLDGYLGITFPEELEINYCEAVQAFLGIMLKRNQPAVGRILLTILTTR